MKKVLIAGSTGFLGSHLLTRLESFKDYDCKVLDRSSGDYSFDRLDQIEESFDLIFVLFALLPNKDSKYEDYHQVNVDLTRSLIEKFPKSRFVFTSSISVYENSSKRPCLEGDISQDISDYARSKLSAEALFADRDAIILRLSSLYGPGMKENTFLPIVLNLAVEKQEILLIGDSSRTQNYSFIDDVVDALIQAGFSSEQGVFNAVNSKSYSNQDLAEILVDLVPGTKITKLDDDRVFPSYEISNQKWLDCFNTEFKISLEEGLARLVKYKANA